MNRSYVFKEKTKRTITYWEWIKYGHVCQVTGCRTLEKVSKENPQA